MFLSTSLSFAKDDQAPLDSPTSLTSALMDADSTWDYAVDTSNRMWLAYYDAARLLKLRDPDGQEHLLVPDDRAQAPSGLDVAGVGSGVGVLWRDKHPRKGLFFQAFTPKASKQLDIGGDTQPLARFVAETDAAGLTHFLWYGEKRKETTGQLHNLYYANRAAGADVSSAPVLVLPGIYPVMSVDSTGGLMAFGWEADASGGHVLARFRPATPSAGQEADGFRRSVVVADVPEITPVIQAFKTGSNWCVMWVGQYGQDRRDFRLEGACSGDDGANWTRFGFDDLRGFDVASLQVAADAKGHVVAAVTARDRTEGDAKKQDVYVVRSGDFGSSWSDAVRIREANAGSADDAAKKASILSRFNARNPSVAFGASPGEVLVVWEDWRTIRSSLYAALSRDDGKTWALSDVPLPRAKGANIGLRYEPNAVYSRDGVYTILGEQYTDDRLESKKIVRISLDASALTRLSENSERLLDRDPKAAEASLRKRAEAYWRAMKEGNFASTYDYLDPFFKARVPLDKYMIGMGKIKYVGANVSKIDIQGPIAEVTTDIRASIPEFKVPTTGELVSRPEREVTVKNAWLMVDGEWVKEFRVESQDLTFTRY